jgi:hypothetical protein
MSYIVLYSASADAILYAEKVNEMTGFDLSEDIHG